MARANILSTPAPSFMDIRPNIIPPSPGDLEEARIKRLMDLAKLKQLEQDPLVQQQQLALQQSQVSETGRHNVATEGENAAMLKETTRQHAADELLKRMGFDLEQRGQDVQQRGQDVQVRGQDLGVQTSRESEAAQTERAKLAAKTATTDQLISHILGSYPQAEDKMTLAKVMALRGDPELLQVMGQNKPTGTGDAMADATLAYMKNKAEGKTISKATGTNTLTNDPTFNAVAAPFPYAYLLQRMFSH